MKSDTDNPLQRPSILLLAAFSGLTSLSIDMNLPAMPQLQQYFASSVSAVQLTLSMFLAGFAIGQLTCGTMSDRFGRRPILIAGMTVFSIAGIACSLSVSLPMLILCRFIQGFGASVGPIIARAVVRDCFKSREASSVLSRITQVMIVAPLLAPTIGGYILVSLGWPSIFVVLGLTGTLVLAVSFFRLPETNAAKSSPLTGRVFVGDFVTVLTHRSSLRHTLTAAFSYAGMFAYISGSPFVLIDVFKVAEQHFGIFFAITSAAIMAGASLNRYLVKNVLPSRLLAFGVYTLLTASLILVAATFAGFAGLWLLILPVMLYMFGLGLVQPNAISGAMAPHGRLAGLSSSLIGSLQTAGAAATGFLVGAFYNHTPMSLAIVMAVMATLSFLVFERSATQEFHTEQPDADLVPESAFAIES